MTVGELIKALEQIKRSLVSKRLPRINESVFIDYIGDSALAWVPLPQSHKTENEDKE